MRFERLRLCGFKSFVEPVDIEIKPGLTGIVGPNGCGKSNLVEGLRWLMGANSAKAMRASGMDEVIFAGTSGGRAARSWAEVTLEIDNSERRAPAQFNDSDTLKVTRRVLRRADGSVSVYSVNGKEVRARDVQMLFADASTGATSPALVRQGQISDLINAKPTDRRRFLEEAAGVTGLAARRHEAQLRLKAAADNLERLDDVIGELDIQSEQLARQARKALKYKALTEDIKDAERQLTAARVAAAHDEHRTLEARMGERRDAVADAASAAASADREATTTLRVVEEARTKEREKATAMTETSANLKSFESEEALRQQAAEDRGRALDRLSGDETRETDLLREASTAIASAEERIRALTAELAAEAETRTSLEDAAGEAEAVAQETERAFEDAQSQAAETRAAIRAAEAARTAAEEQHARAAREKRSLDEKLAGLPTIDEAARASAEAAAHEAQRTLTLAETALQDAEAASAAARAAASTAEADERAARAQLALLEKEHAVLAPLIPKPADDGGSDALIKALAAPGDVRAAIASALGDALYASLGKGAHAWTELGADSGALPSLPEGAQPLDAMMEVPGPLKRRFAAIGVVDAAPTDEQVSALAPGQLLINRRGDLWRWDGYRRPGEGVAHLEELLAAAARLKELEPETEAARRRAEAAATTTGPAREAAEAAAHHFEACRAAHRRAVTEEREASRALEALAREQDTLGTRRDSLTEQLAGATETLAAAEARLAASAEAVRIDPIDEAGVERLRNARDEARRRAGQARGQAAEHRRQSQQRRENLRQQEAQAAAWSERKAAAEARIGELATQRAELERQVAEARGMATDASRGSNLELAAEEARIAWERARDALAEAEQQSTLADRKRREAEAAASSVREALAELSAELRAARQKYDEALADAGIDRDAAGKLIAEAGELPRVSDVQGRLNRLLAERERLGAVNLLASDEQTQVDERLETLRRERRDCEDAASQLQTAVNAINREGRQRLLAAFDAVNGHFRQLFTSLFGGGEAHLKFVDSDDPLAAGLEIFACPPGKKLQSLSLMSGGEQALTATALIFAAFRTNPAPICVLDEVDAPLDDANVERFCDLLSLMAKSSTTRFMVVTHHPLTMSRMDRLFGVTMMERGVSQLFSLDLDSARRLAA